jgi:hypothetical protein
VCLIGVHLMGMCLMSLYLIGMYLMSLYLIPCTADTSCALGQRSLKDRAPSRAATV